MDCYGYESGKTNKGLVFGACSAIIICHIILRNIAGINSPDIIVLMASLLSFVLLPISDAMVFYCFLLPYKSGIGMHEITLLFDLILLVRIFRAKGPLISKRSLLLIVIIILELINCMLGSTDYFEWLRFSVYIVWLAVLSLVLDEYHWDSYLIARMLKAFLYSFVFAACIVIVINSKNTSFLDVVSGAVRIGKTSSFSSLNDMLISFHVNDLAIFCTCAISFVLVLVQRKYINTLIGYSIIAFVLFVGMLTQSRMFVVSVIAILAMIVLFQRRGRLKIIIPILAIILVVYALYSSGKLPVIDVILARFKSTDMATGNGRTEIMNIYNRLMLEHPIRSLIGFGVKDYSSYTIIEAAHNGTQELLVSVGIIGTTCMIVWYIKEIITAQINSNNRLIKNLFNYISLLALVLSIQFTQFISQYHMLCLLALSVILIRIETNQNMIRGEERWSN